MPKAESTIPAEIEALNLPNIERIVLMGSGVLELAGLRTAADIDLVTTRKNRRTLLERNPETWRKITHMHRRERDGSRFQVSSLTDHEDRFDIWLNWYDESRPQGDRRLSLDMLLEHSTQHALGFYVANLEFIIDLKRGSNRVKDQTDARMYDATRQNGEL